MLKFLEIAAGKGGATNPMPAEPKTSPAGVSDVLSPADKLARKRASKALANARQRCTNPNDPEYAGYGAVGIAVLFKNIDELVAAISLPKPGQSLDRINPHGHYEAGNVRWTTAAVQAANKKLSPANVHHSEVAQIVQAKHVLSAQQDRRNVARAWATLRRGFLRGHFTSSDHTFLANSLHCAGVLQSGLDVNTVPDWCDHVPTFIHLPALSLPDARVRLRCMPAELSNNAAYLDTHGRWPGMELLDPSWNVPQSLRERSMSLLHPSQLGLVLTGRPTPDQLLGGWIVGALLALTSSLARIQKVSTAFRPMMTLLEDLDEIGSPAEWDYVKHPILDAEVLLVPDFSLDCGSWGQATSNRWWRVNDLFEYRAQREFKAVIGVQNPTKLHPAVRDLLLGAFPLFKMPATPQHELVKLKFGSTARSIPNDAQTLRSFSLDGSTSNLVVHNGLPGT